MVDCAKQLLYASLILYFGQTQLRGQPVEITAFAADQPSFRLGRDPVDRSRGKQTFLLFVCPYYQSLLKKRDRMKLSRLERLVEVIFIGVAFFFF